MDDSPRTRALAFLRTHARPLERRLGDLLLGEPHPVVSACAVLDLLSGHRNPDGGLGHALEPDVRAPDSQPLAADFALEVTELVLASQAGADEGVRDRVAAFARGLVPYLASVAAPDGGLPIVLPTVAAHPRAAHWGDGEFPPALNPTAGIVARLRAAGVADPWLDTAETFCRERIEALDDRPDGHTAANVLRFLAASPDQDWARPRLAALGGRLGELSLFQLYPGEGYGLTPVDLAPLPDDPLRAFIPDDAVAAHLRALAAAQCPDGGWPVPWEPPGPAAALEWRGVRTVRSAWILAAH